MFSSWVLSSNKQWLHVVDEKIGLCKELLSLKKKHAVCRTLRGNREKFFFLWCYTYLFAQSSLFPLWQASAFQCVKYKASCDQSFQARVSWLRKHTGSILEFFSITYLSNNERSDCNIPGWSLGSLELRYVGSEAWGGSTMHILSNTHFSPVEGLPSLYSVLLITIC